MTKYWNPSSKQELILQSKNCSLSLLLQSTAEDEKARVCPVNYHTVSWFMEKVPRKLNSLILSRSKQGSNRLNNWRHHKRHPSVLELFPSAHFRADFGSCFCRRMCHLWCNSPSACVSSAPHGAVRSKGPEKHPCRDSWECLLSATSTHVAQWIYCRV